jgi:hypothetical protein
MLKSSDLIKLKMVDKLQQGGVENPKHQRGELKNILNEDNGIEKTKEEILEKISEETLEELKDYDYYFSNYKNKLKIIQGFVLHLNGKHWMKIAAELLKLKKITKSEKKRENHFSDSTITDLKRLISLIPEEKQTLEAAITLIEGFNSIAHEFFEIIKKQVEWIEENQDTIWAHHEKLQELLRIIRRESELLERSDLIGKKNERTVLVEIYNHIMPLKERVISREKFEGGVAGDTGSIGFMDNSEIVLKGYGREKQWSKEQAMAGAAIFKEYYQFLIEKKVPIPEENVMKVVSNVESENLQKGIKFSNCFHFSVKQEYIGPDINTILKTTKNLDILADRFNQMMEIINKATSGEPRLGRWMGDFKPINFCEKDGRVLFIDLHPPGFTPSDEFTVDFIIHPNEMTQEEKIKIFDSVYGHMSKSEKKDLLFRLETKEGMFINCIEQTIGTRPDLKDNVVQWALDFIEHSVPEIFPFIKKHLYSNYFIENLKRYIARYSPDRNPKKAFST